MTTQRKLSEYYRFNIEFYDTGHFKKFTRADGRDLLQYNKLTDGQWQRARAYLTRELIPFSGYKYEARADVNKAGQIIKIV